MILKSNFLNKFTPFGSRHLLNRNLKITLKIINFFNFIIVFPIFKIFKIRLLNSSLEAIGHQVMDLELLNYLKNFKDYKILILANHEYIGNKFFFYNYQNDHNHNYIRVENIYLCMLLYFLKKYKSLCLNVHHYSAGENALIYKYFQKIPKKKIKLEHIKLAKEILEKKNINLKKNFVCLHVRNSYLKKYDSEEIRNAKLESYIDTINWLIDKNFSIILMGAYGSISYKFDQKDVIDLTSIKFLNDEKNIIDLYFCSTCDFFIGTQSGLQYLTSYFNRPIILTNMIPLIFSHSINKNGISILKLYRFKESKKYLTIKEIIQMNLHRERWKINYDKMNVEIIDNSSEDILVSVKNLLNFIYSKKNNFSLETNLQKKVREDLYNCKVKYSVFSNSSFCDLFLKKYKDYLF